MSNNVQTIPSFSFHNNSIRVQGTADNPLFCLADVCKVLALQNINHTVKQIQEEFEGVTLNVTPLKTSGGVQKMLMITEPQLYFVMMRSRAKVAREFRQWIVNDVLPSIRKTGAYIQSSKTAHQSYLKIFKDFCLQHNYSNEEIKMFDYLREQALKQGYAIAMSKFEKENNSTNNNDGKISVDFSTVLRMLNLANVIAGRFKYYTEAVHLMEKTLQNIDIIKSDTEYLCGLGDMQMPILRKSLLRASYTDEQKKLIDKTLYPYNQD